MLRSALTATSGGLTMRLFVLSTLIAAVTMAGSMSITAPAVAQAQAPRGPVAYSVAEQKYVGVPCTPTTPKAEAGQAAPCGPVAYSVAEQRYVGIPCTAPTPKAEAGKPAPCGPVAYSVAEQKYVGVPCTHKPGDRHDRRGHRGDCLSLVAGAAGRGDRSGDARSSCASALAARRHCRRTTRIRRGAAAEASAGGCPCGRDLTPAKRPSPCCRRRRCSRKAPCATRRYWRRQHSRCRCRSSLRTAQACRDR